VRFVRQRNRLIGALGQPLLFWLFFSAGLGPTFQYRSVGDAPIGFAEYFFPGTLVLILLFTAIFATISVIEDRREGFLQAVLVAPVSRGAMVLGTLLGGAAIATAQGLLFLLLGLTLGLRFDLLQTVALAAAMAVLSLALTGLGFIIAWRMDSTQGFHAIMSVFLMPLWLLSGAFFPRPQGPLGWIMSANPLTYAVAGLRRLLYWNQPTALPDGLPSLGLCVAVTLAFCCLTLTLSCLVARSRTQGDLL
jgi:ABC-2 type transport system permease protein